jgi:hypothetical protein
MTASAGAVRGQTGVSGGTRAVYGETIRSASPPRRNGEDGSVG